jgi:hypothetical protein
MGNALVILKSISKLLPTLIFTLNESVFKLTTLLLNLLYKVLSLFKLIISIEKYKYNTQYSE